MSRNTNKSEIEEMMDLVLIASDLKKKFSKLITSIMEEDSALKAKLAEMFVKEARRTRAIYAFANTFFKLFYVFLFPKAFVTV